MRIALTITELDPGGAEQCLVQLACFLASHGHEVEVFALGPTPDQSLGSTPQRTLLTEQLNTAGIPWKCGPARGPASLLAVTRWLETELKRMQPELVQSMLFHANFITSLANRRLGLPHVGGARVSQSQWWRKMAQRWAVGRMRKLVCVSQSVADHCFQAEHIPLQKLVVIPNGISLHFSEAQNVRPKVLQSCLPSPQTPFLLFIGRLSSQKGIESLIQQVDTLLDPLPEHHLMVLGDGPLRGNLQSVVQAAQHHQRVHLLGWQAAAWTWLQHADVLLLPSKYEGMPNVVLEAMRAAVPVVTFNVEGISELLGPDCLQVVAGDMSQFILRAQQLATDCKLAEQQGQHNRFRVEQFRLEDQLAKYEKLYAELLSQNNLIARAP